MIYKRDYTFERLEATRVVNDAEDKGIIRLVTQVWRPLKNDRREVKDRIGHRADRECTYEVAANEDEGQRDCASHERTRLSVPRRVRHSPKRLTDQHSAAPTRTRESSKLRLTWRGLVSAAVQS
jgi:hypothetical protein